MAYVISTVEKKNEGEKKFLHGEAESKITVGVSHKTFVEGELAVRELCFQYIYLR